MDRVISEKTAAYFSDMTGGCEEERELLGQVAEAAGAERLIALMSGNFIQNGFPAAEEMTARRLRALEAGVDAVLEMSLYASLSSLGIYAFCGARMLDRLGCVDVLVLRVEAASHEQLEEIALLLIANTGEFQQRVAYYKKQGMPFYRAQAQAIGEKIENGAQLMSSWYNIFAVECVKSLKLIYSSIPCICIPVKNEGKAVDRQKEYGKISLPGAREPDMLSKLLLYQLYFSESRLSDIYGGHEELTNLILKYRKDYEAFGTFAEQIAGADKDLFDVRKYFLRLLCGVTKSDISIWRMYDFAPYCSIHTRKADFLRQLQETSRIPLLGQGDEMDRSKRELLKLEKRAAGIYGMF